jgi:hypothetical protein
MIPAAVRGLLLRERKRDRELLTGVVDENIESRALGEKVLGRLSDGIKTV